MILQQKQRNEQLPLSGFDRFTELLPTKPYCTDNLSNGLIIRPKQTALKYRYIQPNPPALQHWIVFDLDHDIMQPETVYPWDSAGLPVPNFVLYNPENGHAHLFYAIESVCTSPNGKARPLHYLAAIQQAYTDKLRADHSYTGLIAKNPVNRHWHSVEIHTAVFSLGDLAQHVELKPKRWTRQRALNDDHYGLGRNCAMFHRLRFWSYDHVNECRRRLTYNEWMKEVLAKCESMNTFADPLPYGEIKSIAKSVGKWVWVHYTGTGSGRRRGAMAVDLSKSQIPLSLTDKQRLSARRTHKGRRDNTEAKIKAAINGLQEQGKKVTKAAVARLAKIDRAKLYRDYSHLFCA